MKPAQVALVWPLAWGDDIVPIPGTKRINYLEENDAAGAIALTNDQLKALDTSASPVGDRYADKFPLNR